MPLSFRSSPDPNLPHLPRVLRIWHAGGIWRRLERWRADGDQGGQICALPAYPLGVFAVVTCPFLVTLVSQNADVTTISAVTCNIARFLSLCYKYLNGNL